MIRVFLLFAFVVTACDAAGAEDVLLPRLKPDLLPTLQPAVATRPAAKLKLRFPDGGGWPADTMQAARRQCSTLLAGLDLEFEPLAPMGREGGCGTPAPLLISRIASVKIEPPAEANCAFAEALHHWVAWSVKPAARVHLKKRLVTINNASAYACRRRNNSASGKMSEHAFVNALDISTLGFADGSSTSIKGDWTGLQAALGISGKSAFLKRIRRDACIRFTTVLGPGSDRYHGDHFHIDLARRRSGYRICK